VYRQTEIKLVGNYAHDKCPETKLISGRKVLFVSLGVRHRGKARKVSLVQKPINLRTAHGLVATQGISKINRETKSMNNGFQRTSVSIRDQLVGQLLRAGSYRI
jgi:hypothetical protein